jgi:hypothetical protein
MAFADPRNHRLLSRLRERCAISSTDQGGQSGDPSAGAPVAGFLGEAYKIMEDCYRNP